MKSSLDSTTIIVEGNKNSVLVASVGVKNEDFEKSNFRKNIFASLENKEDNPESKKNLNLDSGELNRGDLERTLKSRLSFFYQESNQDSIKLRKGFNPVETDKVKVDFVALLPLKPDLTQDQAKTDPIQTIQNSAQDEIQQAPEEVRKVQTLAQDEIQPAPDEVRKVQASAQDEIQPDPIQPAPIQPASAQIAKGQKVSVQPARAQILSNCTSCCCAGILNYFFYSRRIHPDNSPEIIGANSLSSNNARVEIV